MLRLTQLLRRTLIPTQKLRKSLLKLLTKEVYLKRKASRALLSSVITEIHKALQENNTSMLDPIDENGAMPVDLSVKLPKIKGRRVGFSVEKDKTKHLKFK